VRFRVQVVGEGEVVYEREIRSMSERAANADIVLHEIGRDMRSQIALQFSTQGSHGGEPWEPLAESTIKRKMALIAKRKVINGHIAKSLQILRLTDRLMNSLVRPGPEHVEQVIDHTLFFGTRVPYGEFHQHAKAGGHLPRREWLVITEERRLRYGKAFREYFRTGKTGL
jgi:phage gpG-like protein